MITAQATTEVFYDTIRLKEDEWGNETMAKVAKEYFMLNPDIDYVLVHEHAGWFLGYRRDGTCWATANDCAKVDGPFPTRARKFINRNYPEE